MTRLLSRRNKLILSDLYKDIPYRLRCDFYHNLNGEWTVFFLNKDWITPEVIKYFLASLIVGDLLSVLDELEHYAGTEKLVKMVRKTLDMRNEQIGKENS